MPKKFTEDEIQFLERYYALRGPVWCGKKLKRNRSSIVHKAFDMGLKVGDVEGYVPLVEVARDMGVPEREVRERATDDGVAKLCGTKSAKGAGSKMVVPEKWAAKYAEARFNRIEAEEFGYITFDEAIKVTGLNKGTLSRALKGEGRWAKHFENVRWVRGRSNRWLINPGDLNAATMSYRKLKRELVPSSEVAEALNISNGAAYKRLKKVSEPVIMTEIGKSRRAYFLSEAVEEVLKAAA